MDTTDNILKYRFRHMFKGDIELKIYRFSVGASCKYYSKMENIDRAFQDVEILTDGFYPNVYRIKGVWFWKLHHDIIVWDARISYTINSKQKLSIVCNNVFNVEYSLRPLKIESPRTAAIQYVLTF